MFQNVTVTGYIFYELFVTWSFTAADIAILTLDAGLLAFRCQTAG